MGQRMSCFSACVHPRAGLDGVQASLDVSWQDLQARVHFHEEEEQANGIVQVSIYVSVLDDYTEDGTLLG